MHGNVWEWVENDYRGNIPELSPDMTAQQIVEKSKGVGLSSERRIRGGGWYDGSATLRSSFQAELIFASSQFDLGFRIVLEKVD